MDTVGAAVAADWYECFLGRDPGLCAGHAERAEVRCLGGTGYWLLSLRDSYQIQ